MTKTTVTPEQLATVAHLSSRKAAEALGVGKSTINDARNRAGIRPTTNSKTSSFEQKGDGSLIIESVDGVPQTQAEIHERMRARGFDPDQYSFSYRFSEWEAQTKDGVQTLYSARAGAVEKKGGPSLPSYEEIAAVIDAYQAPEVEQVDPGVFLDNTFIFMFADPQIGKTDLNGGTEQTIERFLNSLAHAEEMLTREPASLIIWADLGDGIENFCNVGSQRQTNDKNLVEQVRILRRLQTEGLIRLAKFAPVIHVSVPSNHSQNRTAVGNSNPASTSHDDWGLEVQSQLSDAFAMATGRVGHPITFIQPDAHLESVSVALPDGTVLGFVHGHRSMSQDGLERWWAGQSLGRQPTAEADILFVGHFHNYSVRSVGKERYIITAPSLDNGSSWFTVTRGNVSTAGVGTMRVADHKFRDFIIA